jgi:hypothetical protein
MNPRMAVFTLPALSTAEARNQHRDMLRRLGAARDLPRVSELCRGLPNLVEKSLAAFPMASGGTVNAGGND